MTQDEIIRMARELAARHGIRMCDEDGETHGEELYCVGIEDIAEIIKEVAAHERNRLAWTQEHWTQYEHAIAATEREACAKACDEVEMRFGRDGDALEQYGANQCAAAIRARSEK